MLAYLQLGLGECDENEFLNKLLRLEQVREAHILFGEWDALVKVEVRDSEQLGTFVLEKIRSLPEVTRTSTMIVAKSSR